MRRTAAELSALIAPAIMQKPCSKKQICLALGMSEHRTDNINHFLRAFHDCGIIYICGYSNWRWPIYAWQDAPYSMPDAQKPTSREATKRMVREMRDAVELEAMPRRPAIGLGPNSVFALGAL